MSALRFEVDEAGQSASIRLDDGTEEGILVAGIRLYQHKRDSGEAVHVMLGDTKGGEDVPMLWFTAYTTSTNEQVDGTPWVFPGLFRHDREIAYDDGYQDRADDKPHRYGEEE